MESVKTKIDGKHTTFLLSHKARKEIFSLAKKNSINFSAMIRIIVDIGIEALKSEAIKKGKQG